MFSCVFVIFPYGVLGQVWYLIVSIPDPCLPLHLTIPALTNTHFAKETTRMTSIQTIGQYVPTLGLVKMMIHPDSFETRSIISLTARLSLIDFTLQTSDIMTASCLLRILNNQMSLDRQLAFTYSI